MTPGNEHVGHLWPAGLPSGFDIPEQRRREKLMLLTFAQSPVPMVRMAWRDGRAAEVQEANVSLAMLLGVSLESLIGTCLDRFVHPDERSISLVPLDGERGQTRQREARMVSGKNETLWVAVTATVVERLLPADSGNDSAQANEAFALVVLEDITARRVAEQTLTHQALHDPLTGLLNRYALVDRLESAISRLWRDSAHMAVMFCDLDGFKHLNDTLGHAAGDQVLVSMSERLRAATRPEDTVARLGGDEFVMICEDLSSPGQAREIAERVRHAIQVPFRIHSRDYGLTVSVGITTTTEPRSRADDLLRQADLAMYRAKDNGRNRVEYYVEELQTRTVARVEATEALRRAISEDRIRVHYQPILALESGRVTGVEALVRLIDVSGKTVHPKKFIGVAEASGLVSPMGQRVLDVALDQLQEWKGQSLALQMNVNVSPRQLASTSFGPSVLNRLRARELDPSSLCLEVTEGAIVHATGPAIVTLRRLRAYGIHIAIDDFGTGYSSLTNLKYLPADVLKIDKSFVKGLGSDRGDMAIVGAVVRIAHDTGRLVVAEGVETREQAAMLADMGCDHVQGFLYSGPVEAHELTSLARKPGCVVEELSPMT